MTKKPDKYPDIDPRAPGLYATILREAQQLRVRRAIGLDALISRPVANDPRGTDPLLTHRPGKARALVSYPASGVTLVRLRD